MEVHHARGSVTCISRRATTPRWTTRAGRRSPPGSLDDGLGRAGRLIEFGPAWASRSMWWLIADSTSGCARSARRMSHTGLDSSGMASRPIGRCVGCVPGQHPEGGIARQREVIRVSPLRPGSSDTVSLTLIGLCSRTMSVIRPSGTRPGEGLGTRQPTPVSRASGARGALRCSRFRQRRPRSRTRCRPGRGPSPTGNRQWRQAGPRCLPPPWR